MIRQAIGSARTLAALSGLLVSSLALAQGHVEWTQQEIELRGGGSLQADFGRVEVPENRRNNASRKISLAVLRVPCSSQDSGPPVFMLAGGPGRSSIEMVRRHVAGGGRMLLEALRGDLVAIDQRGVGQSQPNLESATLYDAPLDEPGDPDKYLDRIRRVCRAEAQRWRDQGVDLSGYTTAESADDVEAVRQALGYERIVLWGESYGTHLALATVRRHSKSIDRAVLIGPEGPDHTIKLPSDAQAALTRIAELVAADATLGSEIPDMIGMLRALLKRVASAPVFVEVDGERVGISKFDIQWLLASKLPRTRKGIDEIPALVKAMSDGDFSAAGRELLELRKSDGVGSAMQMVMDSASGLSKQRAAQIAKEAKECLLGDAINFPFPNVAEAWGAPDLGDAFRVPLKTDIPVLFIVGDLDSRTPLRNARELMENMPNASLIVVENVSHDLPWGVRDIRAGWQNFLAGRAVGVTQVVGPKLPFTRP